MSVSNDSSASTIAFDCIFTYLHKKNNNLKYAKKLDFSGHWSIVWGLPNDEARGKFISFDLYANAFNV